MMLETPFRPAHQQLPPDEDYSEEHDIVEEEGQDAEGTDQGEEEVVEPKRNFKDLLQQYDQLLVAQGVLPAFMLEGQAPQDAPVAADDNDQTDGEAEEDEEEAEVATPGSGKGLCVVRIYWRAAWHTKIPCRTGARSARCWCKHRARGCTTSRGRAGEVAIFLPATSLQPTKAKCASVRQG